MGRTKKKQSQQKKEVSEKTINENVLEKRECADDEVNGTNVNVIEETTTKEAENASNGVIKNEKPSGDATNAVTTGKAKKSTKKKKKCSLDDILEEFERDMKKTTPVKVATVEEKGKESILIETDIKKIKKKIVLKEACIEEQDNSSIRLLKNWPRVEKSFQTNPPTVPLDILFEKKKYPVGEIQEYSNNVLSGRSLQEQKELEKIHEDYYENLRKAAECHRQVRKYMQTYIRPGKKMIDIVQTLERKTNELILAKKLKCGWGFPTGCSLNNCAAHYTPNYGDETILKEDDVCKLDFGVHVNGYIIDCAFTIAFDEKYDNLIKATQDGTNTGIKVAGIDARMCDIGEAIQEVIESYEIELNQKVYPIKAISNLRGHSIQKYVIHGGKCVPIVKQSSEVDIMEEGELFAIETFASTGRGYVTSGNECSHYMRNINKKSAAGLRLTSSQNLLAAINEHFDTLPFCRRWLDDLGQNRHFMALKNLVDLNIVEPYPPLCDIKNSYTSQMEHTILLRPTCKEVLSRGPDY